MNSIIVTLAFALIRPTSQTNNLRQLAYGTSSPTSVSASLATRSGSALGLAILPPDRRPLVGMPATDTNNTIL